MKQLVQDQSSGHLRVVDVPAPIVRPGGVLVRNQYSVISVGTERTSLEFGKKTLLGKAMERPEEVRKVLALARREGLASAVQKAWVRLSTPSALGYSCAGVVEAVGPGVTTFRAGQRVACAGVGYASHAERVWVPQNLAASVPDEVSLRDAAFSTLGAIALHGVRQAGSQLGENVVVIGLGILGQLTVQLLRAAGARVIAIDVDEHRVALSARYAHHAFIRNEHVVQQVRAVTNGSGADQVIVTAGGKSADPVDLAGEIARDRARVVVVGGVPLRVPRKTYYYKELELCLSRSYGPGRYDPEYEEKGHDYPIGYVRWTENRNLMQFLELVRSGAVELEPLVTHSFAFEQAIDAYAALSDPAVRPLGVVLEYADSAAATEPRRIVLAAATRRPAAAGRLRLGVIGAGRFATGTLLPVLQQLTDLQGVSTAGGVSAFGAADKFPFRYLASSPTDVIEDTDTDAVLIATRHDAHARLAIAALRAGKAVFLEKPAALDQAELEELLAAAADGMLMVGFNRRFAPATQFLVEALANTGGARVVHMRVNAGPIPPESWIHDPAIGGGRLLAEGCHFIDLAMYLADSRITELSTKCVSEPDPDARLRDNFQVAIAFANGSIASILYTSKGDARSGKERIEVFAGGTSGVIDDFRRAEFWGKGHTRWKGRQDKGHRQELEAFVRAATLGANSPIPLADIAESARATLHAHRSMHTGRPETV